MLSSHEVKFKKIPRLPSWHVDGPGFPLPIGVEDKLRGNDGLGVKVVCL